MTYYRFSSAYRFTSALSIRTLVAGAALACGLFAALPKASAEEPQSPNTDARMMIVESKTGRVVYDDKRDDMICVVANRVVTYDFNGNPIRRRNMRCR